MLFRENEGQGAVERNATAKDVAKKFFRSTSWVSERCTENCPNPIPHERRGNRIFFNLDEVNEWAERTGTKWRKPFEPVDFQRDLYENYAVELWVDSDGFIQTSGVAMMMDKDESKRLYSTINQHKEKIAKALFGLSRPSEQSFAAKELPSTVVEQFEKIIEADGKEDFDPNAIDLAAKAAGDGLARILALEDTVLRLKAQLSEEKRKRLTDQGMFLLEFNRVAAAVDGWLKAFTRIPEQNAAKS